MVVIPVPTPLVIVRIMVVILIPTLMVVIRIVVMVVVIGRRAHRKRQA